MSHITQSEARAERLSYQPLREPKKLPPAPRITPAIEADLRDQLARLFRLHGMHYLAAVQAAK